MIYKIINENYNIWDYDMKNENDEKREKKLWNIKL